MWGWQNDISNKRSPTFSKPELQYEFESTSNSTLKYLPTHSWVLKSINSFKQKTYELEMLPNLSELQQASTLLSVNWKCFLTFREYNLQIKSVARTSISTTMSSYITVTSLCSTVGWRSSLLIYFPHTMMPLLYPDHFNNMLTCSTIKTCNFFYFQKTRNKKQI